MVRMGEGSPQIWYIITEIMEEKLKHLEFQADDIQLDWKKFAKKNKIDREIFEKYGYFKDIILNPKFQMAKQYIEDNAEFDFVLGDPIMPFTTAIIILFMMQRRVSNTILGLSAAFIFNLNPFYVSLFVLFMWMSGFNNKPRQYRSRKITKDSQTRIKKTIQNAGETKYEHVLVGSDISTLYTAALLAKCGHSCCVIQPSNAAKLEVNYLCY
jgi:hypothetical protein